jgi:hypothetical protein
LQQPPRLPTKFPAARHSIGSSLLTTSSLELKRLVSHLSCLSRLSCRP